MTNIVKANHKWTGEENLICCKEYLKYSLSDISPKPYGPLLDNLFQILPNITNKQSLYMKLQNIKHLCIAHKIPCSITISPLYQVSEANKAAFLICILDPEFESLIRARQEDMKKLATLPTTPPQTMDEIRKATMSFKNKSI